MAPTARAEGGSALPRQATDFEPLIGASKNHHERSLLCCDLDLAGPDHGPTLRPLLSPRVSTAVAAVALAAAGGGFFAAWLLLATFQPPLALEATTLGLKLVSATVLVRHGARSALQQQTWENFTWAEGYGELTTRGMAQGHALGVELRRRYVDELGLLPPSLLADGGHSGLVEAHSTEYDRTQETTWALLMGLFSPLDREAEPVACGCRPKSGSEHSRLSSPACVAECLGLPDPDLAEAIPPLQVIPLKEDWLLRQPHVCKGYQQAPDDTEEMRRAAASFEAAFAEARDFLGEDRLCTYHTPGVPSSGTDCTGPPLTLRALHALYSNLVCAVEAGKPCPVGVEVCGRVEEALSGVNDFFWHADFDGPRGVEAGGTFLGRVVDILEETRQWHEPKAAQNSSFPPPRLSVYGAHDTTIASLLGAMMVPKFGGPEFVAHITWELWGPPTLSSMAVPSDGWVVHIRHQNEPLLGVLGCKSGTCSLEAFMDAMVPSRVRRKEDCQPRDEDG